MDRLRRFLAALSAEIEKTAAEDNDGRVEVGSGLRTPRSLDKALRSATHSSSSPSLNASENIDAEEDDDDDDEDDFPAPAPSSPSHSVSDPASDTDVTGDAGNTRSTGTRSPSVRITRAILRRRCSASFSGAVGETGDGSVPGSVAGRPHPCESTRTRGPVTELVCRRNRVGRTGRVSPEDVDGRLPWLPLLLLPLWGERGCTSDGDSVRGGKVCVSEDAAPGSESYASAADSGCSALMGEDGRDGGADSRRTGVVPRSAASFRVERISRSRWGFATPWVVGGTGAAIMLAVEEEIGGGSAG
ncbi:unnamed protein product [Mycena citricolor]|uniref:Uncharacterized protein n=1 Tax=Mycena citricolor TaxID=2018698 RepID=A0AAD2HID2_9AGAR|nr:unnamed protein product [Mycena citricolor]